MKYDFYFSIEHQYAPLESDSLQRLMPINCRYCSRIHILTYPYPYRSVPNRTQPYPTVPNSFETVLDRTRPYPTVPNRTQPYPTVPQTYLIETNRMRPYPIVIDSFETVLDRTRPYSTVPNRTRPYPTVHDRIKSYPTVSGRTWNNKVVDQNSFEFSIIHYKWFN